MSIEKVTTELKELTEEVKEIQSKKKWYKDVSSLVAVLALFFSFGTTVVTYSKAEDQEYISSRIELRSIMQRLTTLPVEHTEMLEKYKKMPIIASQLSAQLNSENLSLSNQAAAVIQRIESTDAGRGKILDVEYLTVANALSSSFQHEKARNLMLEGYKRVRDATTEAGVLRSLASIELYFKDVKLAREYMKKARAVYENEVYKTDAELNKQITNATTEIQWANMELALLNCVESNKHMQNALKLTQTIPQSPIRGQIESQAKGISLNLKSCS